MRIEFTLDGKPISLDIASNKPLNLILQENLGIQTASGSEGEYGLSIVFVDGNAEISSLIPAFELQGKTVETYQSFRRKRSMREIERAYSLVGTKPCLDCEAPRTILIESLANEEGFDEQTVKKDLKIIKCTCMTVDDQISVVRELRSRRKKDKNHG